MSTQNEFRQRITDQIITAVSDGTKLPPWRKPWRTDANAGHPTNVVSKRGYTGVNPLLLDIAATRHGLKSKWWGIFRQWQGMMVSAALVETAIKATYPNGVNGLNRGEVLRTVFLPLKRQNPVDNVGR